MTSSPRLYFIACSFPPMGRGNAVTNACVANHLAGFFDVVVVCIEHAPGRWLSYQKDQSLAENLNPALDIRRVKAARWGGLNELLYGIGLLPCYYLNWAWSVWRQRRSLIGKPGVVFAVYPVFSDLVVGYLLHRALGYPLIVDFRDDFSGVMSRGWRRLLRGVYRRLERCMVRAAAHVTVTTELLKQDLIKRHRLHDKRVTVVYNVVPPEPGVAEAGDGDPGVCKIVYAGAISRHQRPEILLVAYNSLVRNHPRLRDAVRVEIYGPASPYFERKVRQHLSRGIEYGGFLPHEQVMQRLVGSDVGFLSLGEKSLAYATPTKLFEYIDLEKPVLAVVPPGATRDFIEGMGLGLVADLDDVDQLAAHIHDLASRPELRRQFVANIRRVKDQFSAERQVEKWRGVVAQVWEAAITDPAGPATTTGDA